MALSALHVTLSPNSLECLVQTHRSFRAWGVGFRIEGVGEDLAMVHTSPFGILLRNLFSGFNGPTLFRVEGLGFRVDTVPAALLPRESECQSTSFSERQHLLDLWHGRCHF